MSIHPPYSLLVEMKSLKVESFADAIGAFSSLVCAVHCVAAPSLLVAGSVIPAVMLEDEAFHRAILWVVIPMALIAFGIGCRRHKDRRVMAFGAIGIAGLLASTFLFHDWIGEGGERITTLISAGFLLAAHARNFRRCRVDGCEHDH